jgi:hypothetical protein
MCRYRQVAIDMYLPDTMWIDCFFSCFIVIHVMIIYLSEIFCTLFHVLSVACIVLSALIIKSRVEHSLAAWIVKAGFLGMMELL